MTKRSVSHRSELSLDSRLPKSADQSLPAPLEETQHVHDSQTGSQSIIQPVSPPEMIDRYKVEGLLGEGGYGQVFKAFDAKLERYVAIKIPHLHKMTSKSALESYRQEARTLAKLDHPSVVAVHDVGDLKNGLPFIVSSFIDGTNLARRMRKDPFSLAEGMQILVTIGQALAYVHSRDVVHRDIKPANILLSLDEQPFLADFGLALREELGQTDNRRVGTPSYMSPEQARGETHLVDGRSDLFSLGVVMYEMLTGKLPFRGEDRETMLQNLMHKEPRPLRQINAAIPRELERICLKAMAKRSTDRYGSAADFVDDLEAYLAEFDRVPSNMESAISSGAIERSERVFVVPRGLRSFDKHDSAFFNRLLPGPYDRDWTPESILFWKRNIEALENDNPLRIGVIYGPSGCGKSSFIQAGLVPMLDSSIQTVFVEATRDDTETRVLRGVRKRIPGLSLQDLPETLAEVRRKGEQGDRSRLLIVIDQFEQWLHGRSELETSQLALALRQCDGVSLQCILLLRDDFWLAMSRLATVLEIPLKQNQNVTLVDLFSPHHARRVLADFGVAYDRLPAAPDERTIEQNQFLDQAIDELSEDGKIIPVRLSVFVEMMKSQPWESASLANMGGVEGIGTQFLEECFSNVHAPASHRVHEQAVRKVLRQLLPEQGGNLKGNMRTEVELMTASGYANEPKQFESLMQILDNELRLITPTDPIGATSDDYSTSESESGIRYFQLTHDFLVPALYEWLNKKQRETKRGRAELRLAEFANLWSSKPISQFTPSFFEWLNIRRLVPAKSWNVAEQRMMSSADKRHVTSMLIGCGVIATLLLGSLVWQKRSRAYALIRQLRTAQTSQVRPLLEQIRGEKMFSPAAIRSLLANVAPGSREELLGRLALRAIDSKVADDDVDWMTDNLLTQPMPMVTVLRDEMGDLADKVVPRCVECLQDDQQEADRRLRAAVVLAKHFPSGKGDEQANQLWKEQAGSVVDAMLQHAITTPSEYNTLVASLASQRELLEPGLAAATLSREPTRVRLSATGILIHYFRDDPKRLLSFALGSSDEQQPSFVEALQKHLPELAPELTKAAFADVDRELPPEEFDRLASRKATAAALLHRIGQGDSTWGLLELSSHPNTRTYLAHRIPMMGGKFDAVLQRLRSEPNASVRQALIICLGQFDWQKQPVEIRQETRAHLQRVFQDDPDSGVHSAAQWLLHKTGDHQWIEEQIQKLTAQERDPKKNWYVSSFGQTMAIIDARNVPKIGYVYEIATSEVSVAQFHKYFPRHEYYKHRSPTPDCPVGLTNWYECLEYCRALSLDLGMPPEDSYPTGLSEKSEEQDVAYVVKGGNYRLPTLAEWTYACKAGTETFSYYGLNQSLIDHYYFHWDISIDEANGMVRYFPGGEKIPNPFGLFAMYDGVSEWSHDNGGRYNEDRRMIHGSHSGQDVRVMKTISIGVARELPNARNGFSGLRVARTVAE